MQSNSKALEPNPMVGSVHKYSDGYGMQLVLLLKVYEITAIA